jgi:hypothetical protein
VRALDTLFSLKFVAAALFVFRSRKSGLSLSLAILMATAEIFSGVLVWDLGGASVSGYYL